MRGRPLRLSILFVQVVWLNAILPGHTRGQIVMPGGEPASVRTCHRADGGGPCRSKDPISPERKSRCAVCFFAIRMVAAPALVIEAPEMALLAVEAVPEAPAPADAGEPLPERDRGPPAARATIRF